MNKSIQEMSEEVCDRCKDSVPERVFRTFPSSAHPPQIGKFIWVHKYDNLLRTGGIVEKSCSASSVREAHRQGWEQAKMMCAEITDRYSVRDDVALDIKDAIAAMDYKEPTND